MSAIAHPCRTKRGQRCHHKHIVAAKTSLIADHEANLWDETDAQEEIVGDVIGPFLTLTLWHSLARCGRLHVVLCGRCDVFLQLRFVVELHR